MIWNLIKKFMTETENANNIQFADSAWQRAKQLEADIVAAQRKEWDALVESSDNLIDEKAARIKDLESSIRKVIYGVRGIDLGCEKWVTAELSRVLPGYAQIDGSDAGERNANG